MGLRLAYSATSEPEPVCKQTYPYTAGVCYESPGYRPEAVAVRRKYDAAIRELGLSDGDFKVTGTRAALCIHLKKESLVQKLHRLADEVDIPVPQNPNARHKPSGSYEPPLKGLF